MIARYFYPGQAAFDDDTRVFPNLGAQNEDDCQIRNDSFCLFLITTVTEVFEAR